MPNDADTLTRITNYEAATESISTDGEPSQDHFAAIARAGFNAVANLTLRELDDDLG